MIISEITAFFEKHIPLQFQENYDNSGLQFGNLSNVVQGVLLCIDVTEDVVKEAVNLNCNLIISHHPLIFSGLKYLRGTTYVERALIMAIKNDIAIYSIHTNIDNFSDGVNKKICEKLGLINCKVLAPVQNFLYKLVTFVPDSYAVKVRESLFTAGAGHIGNYDSCSYTINGNGTFRALDAANPFVGKTGEFHTEPETRIETIIPKHLINKVASALKQNHPYEEVAYDIYPVINDWELMGAGMIGELEHETDALDFLKKIKQLFNAEMIRYTPLLGKPIKKVALCGGSGSFLLPNAKAQNADIFISSDFKYHQFFDAEAKIVIADIGHFESEQFTQEIFYDLLTKKFTNIAVYFTSVNTNPLKYL